MDSRELEGLIREHQAALYRYVRHLGAERSAAEDLVQESFLRAMKASAVPDLAQPAAWRAWLRTTARNLLLAEHRRGVKVIDSPESVLELADAAWVEVIGDQDGESHLAALRECLDGLPPRQREAIDQRYRINASRSVMARDLNLSEDGVKMLLRRVREALARCMESKLDPRAETGPMLRKS